MKEVAHGLDEVFRLDGEPLDDLLGDLAGLAVGAGGRLANLTLHGEAVYLAPLEPEHPEAHSDVRRILERLGDLAQVDISHGPSVTRALPDGPARVWIPMGPEPAAPGVVAVVVASGHEPWLGEVLGSLAAQDYSNLSFLVADVGTDGKLADRVASSLPQAHFARMPAGTGFVEAANRAIEMVAGVAHVLLCHNDVALAPDAVRLLLEEAYRSNAGLTCPKFVMWDAPDRLLSVGMGADHLGVVHSLVEPGELDQGQHDAAREVFVAPSGALLVRRDLWRALGGFNADVGGPGEDLDLSWRAHLAGARVVVAPQARARHFEVGPEASVKPIAKRTGLDRPPPAPTPLKWASSKGCAPCGPVTARCGY